VRGTYEWLRGERGAAHRWWRRSLAEAARMGTRHLAGQTHLEIARRTGDREHLAEAIRVFEAIGATLDLAEARGVATRA
jgi:hypothetical protein